MTRARFEAMLREGKANSLGRTEEVVDVVLDDRRKVRSLYACYGSDDEWVRLRVSNAFKRVFRAKPEWFEAWADRFIDEVAAIEQPSAQWTVAQLLTENADVLDEEQTRRAKRVLKRLLDTTEDWIVDNSAMQGLAEWAVHDARLRAWLLPRLEVRTTDRRGSIARRAAKLLAQLQA